MRNVIAIQKEDEYFLQVFGNSEGDSGHEDVLVLSETEHQAEQQQLEEQKRASPRGL